MARPEKILIVDDDESWLEVCRIGMETLGFAPETSHSGNDALRLIEKAQYNLVITDLQMPPPGDGRAVTLGVKTRWPTTDVILMTAAPTISSAVAVLKDGASDYLIKPFSMEAFEIVVDRVLTARRQSAELAVERRLREELEAAYAELKHLDKLKEGFLARVSHELNTPLAAASLAVALLAEEMKADDPLKRHLNRANDAMARLREVIENLLAFVDLQKPDMEVHGVPTPLAPLLEEVLREHERLARTKALVVTVDIPPDLPDLRLHRELMKRAFGHLVKNAIYFNRPGGRLQVSARRLQHWVSVTITDTGEGLPADQQAVVFDAFYQVAEYMTRTVGGLGLGLSLVKRIVEAHKGVVRLDSKAGEGTTVAVQLPL
ncbi:MAG: response regulator [Elusimicrobia bacterium]|nr:response regulator [Elusimicrobiota bacterium]